MYIKRHLLIAILALVTMVLASAARADVFEDFETDPFESRALVVGSNKSLDTAAAEVEPFTYTESSGVLTHNLCTNWRLRLDPNDVLVPDTSSYEADGSRFHIALDRTYNQDANFSFGAKFRIVDNEQNPFWWSGGFMQMNFGLLNDGETGMDRTSSLSSGGNTFDSIDWSFFPDNNPVSWATVQQVMFGSQNGAQSALDERFAAVFGNPLPNTGGAPEYGLPLNTWMEVVVRYDAATRTACSSVVDSASGIPLAEPANLPDVLFPDTWNDGSDGLFTLDTLSVMNYQDAWAWMAPSIVGKLEYDNIWFQESAPWVPGDCDLDGDVDWKDYQNLEAGFGTGRNWCEGNFDQDGDVDWKDYQELEANFGYSEAGLEGVAPVAGPVPEPMTLPVLALGAAGLLVSRRKRVA